MEDITISPYDVKEKIHNEEDVLLLDVREPGEFKTAQIHGAKLIPLKELSLRTGELPKDAEIIAYCHHGVRSLQAAHLLTSKGFNAKSMAGGIDSWSQQIDGHVPRY
ncbi:MAG: rhodanese [DPANN group archaeon]|nr:rhodanese [DPANN group archaeon]